MRADFQVNRDRILHSLPHTAALLLNWFVLVVTQGIIENEAWADDSLPLGIVYGEDDRVDLYRANEQFVQIAKSTAIALIAPAHLRLLDDGNYAIEAPLYGELQSLCPGERFSEQPAAASCSGVLLAPDIVLTAGHCLGVTFDGSPDCTNNRYVVGFGVTEPGSPITIPSHDVFECQQVLGRVKTPPESPCHFDFALVALERSVPDAVPASIRDQPVQQGESVAVVGFTAGLPIKIDQGAQVIDTRSEQRDFLRIRHINLTHSTCFAVLNIYTI